jgi:hypothetical protein
MAMRYEEIKALFDQQAAGYDKQWAGMAPIREALYLLLDALFIDLPADARILCVGTGTGTGTGAEIAHMAEGFPGWRFTALDPSGRCSMCAVSARSTAALPSAATFTRAIWIRWRLGRSTTALPVFWCRSFCSNRRCVLRSSARSRSA